MRHDGGPDLHRRGVRRNGGDAVQPCDRRGTPDLVGQGVRGDLGLLGLGLDLGCELVVGVAVPVEAEGGADLVEVVCPRLVGEVDRVRTVVLQVVDRGLRVGHLGDAQLVEQVLQLGVERAVDAALLDGGLQLGGEAAADDLVLVRRHVLDVRDDEVTKVGAGGLDLVAGQPVEQVAGEDRRLRSGSHDLLQHGEQAVGLRDVAADDGQGLGSDPLRLLVGGGGARRARGQCSGGGRGGLRGEEAVAVLQVLEHLRGDGLQLEGVTVRVRLEAGEEQSDDQVEVLLDAVFGCFHGAVERVANGEAGEGPEVHDVLFLRSVVRCVVYDLWCMAPGAIRMSVGDEMFYDIKHFISDGIQITGKEDCL